MTLRVGVNLLWLVPDEVGGSGAYALRLLEALAGIDQGDTEVTLFVNGILGDHPEGEKLASTYRTVRGPTSGASRAQRVGTEVLWLPAQVRRRGIDVVHDAGGLIAHRSAGGTLLTVHDLQPLAMPENFGWVKRNYMATALPRSARVATRLATLTAFVADDLSQRLHVDPSRLLRVPPGVTAPVPATPAELEAVVDRYGLAGVNGSVRPFFMYPAITYPHKNHVLLAHSFSAVCRERPEALLVLTGGVAQREERLLAAIERLGIGANVRRTGRVPSRDIEVLYQEATALSFASRYEGCGIPVIEAMASGCPVIASDCTGLPEMVGDAGVLVGAMDSGAWSAAMLSILEDSTERARLTEAGLVRARRFDWTSSARCLLAAYMAVADA